MMARGARGRMRVDIHEGVDMEANTAGMGGMSWGVMVVGTIISILVGAGILMLATRMVEKFTPSFGNALAAAIAGVVASSIIKWLVRLVLPAEILTSLLAAVAGFLVTAWVIMKLIRRPSGKAMPYGRACQIALVEWVILLVLLALIGMIWLGGAAVVM